MADDREKQQDAQSKSDSTSMKGQTSDSGRRDSSDQRTERRSGTQIMGSGPSESDQRDGTEPENRGNRYSGVRINEPGQIRDHRESDIQQQQRASTQYYEGGGSGSQRRSDDTSPISCVHPIRPGAQDCQHYQRTGRCGYGSFCLFNHHNGPVRVNCEFFLRGECKFGARCRNIHSMETDGAQRIRKNLQGQRPSDIERQRAEAAESERKRKRELENTERENRQKLDEEKPENSGVNALGQENLLEEGEIDIERQREIERKRTEERQQRDKMKPTVTFDSAEGTTRKFEEMLRTKEDDD